ncbi:hypothetical protein CALCODRAFT_203343 [Calocera cornea HHB12733]|uniref:Uncharacterized protein n=1 Tax=Calocera cornea HHB12733 TaxID=1353952 RepID=A0A165JYL3_9BASI|nr:hypothetical protein CALCODRAFT_203343 [Calocera cornea HHB12733]
MKSHPMSNARSGRWTGHRAIAHGPTRRRRYCMPTRRLSGTSILGSIKQAHPIVMSAERSIFDRRISTSTRTVRPLRTLVPHRGLPGTPAWRHQGTPSFEPPSSTPDGHPSAPEPTSLARHVPRRTAQKAEHRPCGPLDRLSRCRPLSANAPRAEAPLHAVMLWTAGIAPWRSAAYI